MLDFRPVLTRWLVSLGLSEALAYVVTQILLGLTIVLICLLANWAAKKFVRVVIQRMIRRTRTDWDDVLLEKGFFNRISHLAPAIIIYASAKLFPELERPIADFGIGYMGLIGLLVFGAFLDGVSEIYRSFEAARTRPIRGYVQGIKVFVYILGAIAILATLLGESPWKLLSGIGALTAIVLLVFKDSILGLVASIQITVNDMVRIGDWIEMPKYGADGDVIDVSIQCVKVCNFDKTITTIPTYALVSDSFRNWRGMQESGGRRIKRAIYIDMNSVKFCNDELIDRFRKIHLLRDYLDAKLREVEEYNLEMGYDPASRVDGRRLTNVGTFRAYIREYLRHHPKVRQDMTTLVRHLSPSENGLPIEIYVFSNDIRWSEFESIQADIFDHMLAVIPEFELRVFQRPTGLDFTRALSAGSKRSESA